MQAYLPWILGGLGGGGVLLVWYGIKDLRAPDGESGQRRKGLLMVNIGVLMVCGSLALTIFAS